MNVLDLDNQGIEVQSSGFLRNNQQDKSDLQILNGKNKEEIPLLSITNYVLVIKRQVKACIVYSVCSPPDSCF